MNEIETILPPVQSKFDDGHPVGMGKIEVERVTKDELIVRIWATDGRLAYEVGPIEVLGPNLTRRGGKLTLNLPK